MDVGKTKELLDNIRSLKSAKFYNSNWAFVAFKTELISLARQEVIRTSPLNHHRATLTSELNDAIQPVLEKYIRIFEDELRKNVNKSE